MFYHSINIASSGRCWLQESWRGLMFQGSLEILSWWLQRLMDQDILIVTSIGIIFGSVLQSGNFMMKFLPKETNAMTSSEIQEKRSLQTGDEHYKKTSEKVYNYIMVITKALRLPFHIWKLWCSWFVFLDFVLHLYILTMSGQLMWKYML